MLFWLVETHIIAGFFAIVAALASRYLTIGPAARHALWLLVLIKLLTPPLIRWPIPTLIVSPELGVPIDSEELSIPFSVASARSLQKTEPDLENLYSKADLDMERAAKASPSDSGTIQSDVFISKNPDSFDRKTIELSATRETPLVEPSSLSWRWGFLLMGAWLMSSVGLGIGQSVRIARFAQKLRHAEPVPNWMAERIAQVAATMQVRPPRAFFSDGCGSPFLWCGIGTRLVIPVSLSKQLDGDRWNGILAHEMAHLRRRDPWTSRMALIGGVLWWWNPLYWWVRNRLDVEAELACDAMAAGNDPRSRRLYAEALLDVCEWRSASQSFSPALGLGGQGRFLERRLRMIFQEQKRTRRTPITLTAWAVVALLTVPSWGQTPPKPPEPPRTEATTAPAAAEPAASVPTPPTAPTPLAVFGAADAGRATPTQPATPDEADADNDVEAEPDVSAALAEAHREMQASQAQLRKAQLDLMANQAKLNKLMAKQGQKLAATGPKSVAFKAEDPFHPIITPRTAGANPKFVVIKSGPIDVEGLKKQIEAAYEAARVKTADGNSVLDSEKLKRGIEAILKNVPGSNLNKEWEEQVKKFPTSRAAAPRLAPTKLSDTEALKQRMDVMESKLDAILKEMQSEKRPPG